MIEIKINSCDAATVTDSKSNITDRVQIIRKPFVTNTISVTLIVAIITVYLYQQFVIPGFDEFDKIRLSMFHPIIWEHGTWCLLITSLFVHYNWIHLIGNVINGWIILSGVETSIHRYINKYSGHQSRTNYNTAYNTLTMLQILFSFF